MNQQIVIHTASGLVLRAGYCDFLTDGTFDPATETILASGVDYPDDVAFDPPISASEWIWNGQGFDQGNPISSVPTQMLLRSPNGAVFAITVDNQGTLTTTGL